LLKEIQPGYNSVQFRVPVAGQDFQEFGMAVIDIHPHVISSDTSKYPRAPLGGHQSDWSRDRPVGVEQMIAAMDRAGIAKSALVQASTCYGHDNSYVADAVAAHPDRFTGVFSADVLAPDAVETMARWMARGLTGLRLFTTGSTMPGQADWLDDPRSFLAWDFAAAKNLPVCLQMTAKGIPQLTRVLDRFPGLRVILDHLARPVQEDGPPYANAESLWSLARHPQVYLKVTERNLVGARAGKATPETFFGRLVGDFGAQRIAWGSNFPASERSLPELVRLAQDTLGFLPARDREWIFAGTAEVLYPALRAK
jgi:predicted TIM-barrel fold metal-dependent hydrolase